MKNLKVSLVIPAHNEEKYIGDCLDSVIKNSGGNFCEIIVVDNNSNDKTEEISRSKNGVRVVNEARKGVTIARNRGLKETTGDLVAFIDADTIMPPNWLPDALRFFEKHPNAVSLSGPYHYHDASFFQNFLLTVIWWLSAPLASFISGYAILGGNFIAKKDILMKIDGFDETIKFYGDDMDIARRLSKFGKVVFKMNFFIYSSCRRFAKEGLIKTNITYALNFLSEVFFHKPFTDRYNDIRTNNNNEKNRFVF